MRRGSHQTLRKLIAYFLLAAVSLFFAPKELIHNFFHHEDTCDVITHYGLETEVGELHEHCDILQLSVPPLIHPVNHLSFAPSGLLCIQSDESTSSYHFSTSAFLFFRGPPAV